MIQRAVYPGLLTEPAALAEPPAPAGLRRKWTVLVVLLAAPFLAVLDAFVVLIAVPSMQDQLHASNAGVQLVVAGYGVLIVGGDHPVNTSYLYCAPGDNENIFLPTGEVRTGDLARVDDDGYLYILGRADDLIVLANGKNVHVRKIEERIKQHRGVGECVLYGSGKPHLVAVISPAEPRANDAPIMAHIGSVNATLPPD